MCRVFALTRWRNAAKNRNNIKPQSSFMGKQDLPKQCGLNKNFNKILFKFCLLELLEKMLYLFLFFVFCKISESSAHNTTCFLELK